MCSIEDVSAWGPFILNAAQCEHLSFTLLFEEAFMSLLPSIIALLAATYRINALAKRDARVKLSWLRVAKLVTHSCFAILSLVQLGLYAAQHVPRTKLSLASSALLFLAALSFVPLSALEHTRSLRPCMILEIYQGVSIPLGIIQCKTLWLVYEIRPVAIVSTLLLVVRLLVLVMEAQGKRKSILPPYRDVPPDGTGGVFSSLTLFWILPLLMRGYSSILTLQNLISLHADLKSRSLLGRALSRWNRADQRKVIALFFSILNEFKYTFLAGGAFRLALVALRLAQPFMVQAELKYIHQGKSALYARGTWLIVAYAGVYTGVMMSRAGSQYFTRRFIVQVRGSLITLMVSHLLEMNPHKVADLGATSLVGVDMEKISNGFLTVHEAWASLIEIILFLWMIEKQLGLAVVASALASLSCLVASFLISARAYKYLTAWLEDTQRRVNMTESALGQFKPIALAGFMDPVLARISSLRDTEIQTSKTYRTALVGVTATAYASSVLAPVMGFGLFAFVPSIHGNQILSSEVVFPALAALTLFTSSILVFVQSMFEFMSAFSGFKRYWSLLVEPPLVDPRLRLTSLPLLPALTFQKRVSILPDIGDVEDGNISMQTFTTHQPLLKSNDACIVAQDAKIGWDEQAPVIQQASFSLRAQKITGITGGPGSGKTTLLEAFLGHVQVSRGSFSTSFTTAAYCSQLPWIFEGTIMDNIVNCSILNTSRYRAVIEACGLHKEISGMPLRDKTPVGNGGTRLSGGQRKRVALARAVYSGLDVLVLDDVLSGLDPETSSTVWRNLCGNDGMLRREGRTVIFASVHTAGLNLADDVWEVKGGKVQRRPQRHSISSIRSSLDLSKVAMETTIVPDRSLALNRHSTIYDDPSILPGIENASHGEHQSEEKVIQTQSNFGDWQAYTFYIASLGRHDTLIFLCLCLFMVLGLQLPQLWIGLWAKANEHHNGLSSATYYGVYIAFGGLALLALVLGGLYFLLRMVPRSARVLHQSLLQTTLRASIVFINNQSVGSVINRFTQDLTILDTEVPISGFNFVFYVLSCLVQVVVISVSSKYMAAVMAAFLVLFYAVQSFYLRTSRQLRVLDIEAKAPLLSHLSGVVLGLKTIRSGGWTSQVHADALQILDNSQKPLYLLYSVQVWLGMVLDGLVVILAITLVSITNRLSGSATSGFLGVALTSIVNFGVNLNELLVSWTYIETALQAALRIRDYTRDTPIEVDGEVATSGVRSDWPHAGKIEFRNVCASYGENAGRVLDDLSFVVQPGETVGICGRSGSGKSSLLATLYRLLELDSGSILIDGVETNQVPRRELRLNLLNIPQDAFTIPGTLRYNLDPAGVISDEELVAALRAVQLWDIIDTKDGLQTPIKDCSFSSGAKQGLSLARALVRKGKIIIVDELTSNLDTENASFMRDTLRNHFQRHTILVVSHRLEDLLSCDKVLVIEDGRFVEFDDARELWNDDKSRFRRIFASAQV